MTKHTILFLAANPQGGGPGGLDPQARRSAFDLEARAIRKELKLSGYGDRFDLVTRWAAEPHDLLRELRAFRPTVVHFSGHGGPGGLFFQAPDGEARVVSPEAIAETFEAAGAGFVSGGRRLVRCRYFAPQGLRQPWLDRQASGQAARRYAAGARDRRLVSRLRDRAG